MVGKRGNKLGKNLLMLKDRIEGEKFVNKTGFFLFFAVVFFIMIILFVSALPVCDCNEHTDCNPDYMCVEPVELYNSCSSINLTYLSHCKPCPQEGDSAYYGGQCGGERCTYGFLTNDHCCKSGETYIDGNCMKLTVTPSSQDFGIVLTDSCSSTKNFDVSNSGTGTLTGTASVNPPFSCVSGCSYNIPAGESRTVSIKFCPAYEEIYNKTVSFSGGGGATATVTGEGKDPDVYYTLTVSKTGTGSGTVTDSGINCGTDCSQPYLDGTSVTLYASAAAGSTFASWDGACSGTGNCIVTMNSNKSVTATFNSVPTGPYTLTVTKSGAGSGTVTSSPAGINCGTDCSESYSSGTSVTLTANALSLWGRALAIYILSIR